MATRTNTTTITRRAAMGFGAEAAISAALVALPAIAATDEADDLRQKVAGIIHDLRNPSGEKYKRILIGAHWENLETADRLEAVLKGGAS
jgi:hypothetical protein